MKPSAAATTRLRRKREGYEHLTKLELIAALEARDRETPEDVLKQKTEEQRLQMELQNEQLSEAHTDLEQSRHRCSDLYDQAPVGYVTFDDKGCVREINHSACELLGCSAAHVVGKPFIPHLAQPDRKLFLQHLWRCRRAEGEIVVTLRTINNAGAERLVEFISRPADHDESKAGLCRSAIIDVTDKRATEAALSASEAKFRLLADNIGDVFWFLELEPFQVSYVSPAFERIWGIPVGELYADHKVWERSMHPDDLPQVREAFRRWIISESRDYHVHYRVIHRDGSIRWIADQGIVISDKDSRPFHLSGIARDITERKQTEELLAEKARERRAILEGAFDGILIADLETRRFTFGNTAICKMLGVTKEEIVTMDVESIHPAESLPEIGRIFAAMARGEQSIAENAPLLRKDGSITRVDISGAPVVINGRSCNVGIFRDITERQRAEEKFRSLLEAAPDAMMIHGTDGRILIVNAEAEKLFGYMREELIGQTMEMLMPERFRHHHVQHRAGYTPTSMPRPMGAAGMTLLALHKDGREIPVEISISNLGTNGTSMVISSTRDITERIRAEQALRESEERFRGFFENVAVGTAQIDEQGHFIRVNDRYCEFAGYAREELLGGMGPLDLIHPDEREADRARLEPLLQGRSLAYDAEKRIIRKDGREVWLHVSSTAILNADGTFHYAAGVVENITERKLAEDALRQSQRFAQSTLEAIPASLAVLEETGTIISTNDSWMKFAEENCGFPCATGIGANYLAVCDGAVGDGAEEAARFAAGIRSVLGGDTPRFSMEYPCHSPQEQRWFVGYVTPFTGDGPRRAVIAHLDISQRKRAELVIRRLNEELESRVEKRTLQLRQLNEELQQQIAARKRLEEEILEISEREQQRIGQDLHDDLGQQLAGAWMMSTVLERNLTSRAAPEAPTAGNISELLKKAVALTRSLARGLHPVAPEPGGLTAALRDLAARVNEMFHIDCRFKCASAVDVYDNTTATHLYRIAQEAVSNGIKHGHAKNVRIHLSSDAESTTLTVEDDGTGIGKLDPNHQGMGLRIMHYRVGMIGARISIEKQKGGGTCVTCTLPKTKPLETKDIPHGKKNRGESRNPREEKSSRRR